MVRQNTQPVDDDVADLIGRGGDGRSLSKKDNSSDGEFQTESVAADQLKSFVERLERLEEEKKSISDDIKEVYSEAKGNGFDTKVLRKLVSIRKRDAEERQEEEAILELYMHAMGMI
jgi:uncharacterized protein (UPF0335 family)